MLVPGDPRLSELLGNLKVVLDFSNDDPSIKSLFNPEKPPTDQAPEADVATA